MVVSQPRLDFAWQFNTAQWSALPYGDIAEQLGVDRIVYVEIYEYRIHPPGNRLMMEGVCAATIGIIERDSIDPDNFAQAMDITTMFPEDQHVTIDEIAPDQMRFTLTSLFIRDTAWLFHRHIEPKYPDKYQGSIPETFPGSNQG